jgi:hypothetical protein
MKGRMERNGAIATSFPPPSVLPHTPSAVVVFLISNFFIFSLSTSYANILPPPSTRVELQALPDLEGDEKVRLILCMLASRPHLMVLVHQKAAVDVHQCQLYSWPVGQPLLHRHAGGLIKKTVSLIIVIVKASGVERLMFLRRPCRAPRAARRTPFGA